MQAWQARKCAERAEAENLLWTLVGSEAAAVMEKGDAESDLLGEEEGVAQGGSLAGSQWGRREGGSGAGRKGRCLGGRCGRLHTWRSGRVSYALRVVASDVSRVQ